MTNEEIMEKLRQAMKQSSIDDIDWNSVSGDENIQSLGFDSLSILDLIYDIQQEFGIDFEAEDLANTKTVNDLILFLKDKV